MRDRVASAPPRFWSPSRTASALGITSHSEVRAVASLAPNGNGIRIDLSRYGGGGIYLWRFFDINGLDASDFLL